MSEVWIYHERQEALLCGQHALNNLVQAEAFNVGDLSDIAHQLDQMELNYMANNEHGVNSKDYLRRVAEGSGNVDPSGNFSIEVSFFRKLYSKQKFHFLNLQTYFIITFTGSSICTCHKVRCIARIYIIKANGKN